MLSKWLATCILITLMDAHYQRVTPYWDIGWICIQTNYHDESSLYENGFYCMVQDEI